MVLSSSNRTLLRQRIKKIRDMGGVSAISRKSGLSRVTIYNALKRNTSIRKSSYNRLEEALAAIEAGKKVIVAS